MHQDQDLHNSQVAENRLALQLYAIIEHYKNEDPIGFPGAPIPDPMSVPDIKKSLGVATLNMMKIQAFGLSKFRIASINVNLEAMKVLFTCMEMISSQQFYQSTSSLPHFPHRLMA